MAMAALKAWTVEALKTILARTCSFFQGAASVLARWLQASAAGRSALGRAGRGHPYLGRGVWANAGNLEEVPAGAPGERRGVVARSRYVRLEGDSLGCHCRLEKLQ